MIPLGVWATCTHLNYMKSRIIIAGLENHTCFDAATKCLLIPVFRQPIVSGSTWIHLHCRIYIYQPVLNAPGCNLLYSVRTTSALSSNFACSSFNFLRCRRRHVSSATCQCWPWVIHGHAIYHPFHGATYLVGGWPTPLKNMKVSWDYYSQYIYIWKNKKCSKPPTSYV